MSLSARMSTFSSSLPRPARLKKRRPLPICGPRSKPGKARRCIEGCRGINSESPKATGRASRGAPQVTAACSPSPEVPAVEQRQRVRGGEESWRGLGGLRLNRHPSTARLQAGLKREGEESHPISPYASSRAAMELGGRALGLCCNLPFVGLRFHSIRPIPTPRRRLRRRRATLHRCASQWSRAVDIWRRPPGSGLHLRRRCGSSVGTRSDGPLSTRRQCKQYFIRR